MRSGPEDETLERLETWPEANPARLQKEEAATTGGPLRQVEADDYLPRHAGRVRTDVEMTAEQLREPAKLIGIPAP